MSEPAPTYDAIGRGYSVSRQADPRIAAQIRAALGDAASVVNVGAGTGGYEPAGLDVTAVEPSAVMIGQRPPGSAPAIQGAAEALPLGDGAVDVAMAVLSDHHWADRAAGLRELRRVARQRVVLVNASPEAASAFWFTRDYLPEFTDLIPEAFREAGAWEAEFEAQLGPIDVEPVLVPHDCTDGFYSAYWRRPEAYLDPAVRENISVFHRVPASAVDRATKKLRADLDSGAWRGRNGHLVKRDELDVGLRIVVAELR